ncbi:MAG: hypothetical protein N2316_04685 [Spirochaetes bacterium]|nr:hypothetical protein [Spirochaetota bacterium]
MDEMGEQTFVRESFLASIIDALPIPVFYKDKRHPWCVSQLQPCVLRNNFRSSTNKDRVTHWNRQTEETFGIPKERALIVALNNHATNKQIKQPIQVIAKFE